VASFPRPRRLRETESIRDLVADVDLDPKRLICPLFVKEGLSQPREISTMPGVYQHTLDSMCKKVDQLLAQSVTSVMLFAVTDNKDEDGGVACRDEFILQRALDVLTDRYGGSLTTFADLCLDEYTTHGHCGVLDSNGRVDNDATLVRYQDIAKSFAHHGVDFVAPSGMMDHQVAAIREALDGAAATGVGILAYSAKYASSLYGPFRDAVEVSIANGGDRSSYQQDIRNGREALREVDLDVAEGADLIMVKPASYFLDIIAQVGARSPVPVAAYQVSGEYAMIMAAGATGAIDARMTARESLVSITRAGAPIILTYFADRIDAIMTGKGWP